MSTSFMFFSSQFLVVVVFVKFVILLYSVLFSASVFCCLFFCFCFCLTLKLYTVICIVFHEQIKSILTIFRCMFVFIILDGVFFFSLASLLSVFIGIQLHSSHIYSAEMVSNGFLLISFMSFLSKFFSQILLFCFALFSVWFNINTCVQRMWFGFYFHVALLSCFIWAWLPVIFFLFFFLSYFAILYAIYFLLFCFFYSASRTSFYNKKNESTCKTKCKDLVFVFSFSFRFVFERNGFLL